MKEIGYLNFKDMRKSSLYIIISLLFCNLSCTEYLDVKNIKERLFRKRQRSFQPYYISIYIILTGLESMLFQGSFDG